MTNISILYLKGKFALSVDGQYQDIASEDALLAKLIELGSTRDRAMADIARLKATQAEVRVK